MKIFFEELLDIIMPFISSVKFWIITISIISIISFVYYQNNKIENLSSQIIQKDKDIKQQKEDIAKLQLDLKKEQKENETIINNYEDKLSKIKSSELRLSKQIKSINNDYILLKSKNKSIVDTMNTIRELEGESK